MSGGSPEVTGAPRSEIVGPGDLIRPWERDEVASVPFDSRWQAVRPTHLTHEMLSQLVCAQRPTVTTSLQRLAADGRLRRRRDRTWLLAHEPPALGLRQVG